MSHVSRHPPDGFAARLAALAREHASGALDQASYRRARAALLDALDVPAPPRDARPAGGSEGTVRIPAAASPRRRVARGRAKAWAFAALVLLAGMLAGLWWW